MKTRIPLAEAGALACELVDALRSACERIEVAGSIRRRSETVGDIEIVAVPRIGDVPYGLFDDLCRRGNWLDIACDGLCEAGSLAKRPDANGRTSWGERLKRATWRGFPADIFSVICTPKHPAQWGVIFTIRTGPAEFSHRLVTSRTQGGLMPPSLCIKDGALWYRGGSLVPTPEEIDLFEAIGLAWIPPEGRV